MIRVETVVDDMLYEVDRLSRGLTGVDNLEFEIVLQEQYDASKAAVHRITRSLALSAKMESKGSKDHWEGEITYGGFSYGIHNPVDYAEYERERGGEHDFLAPAEHLSNNYYRAIFAFFKAGEL